MNKRLLRVVADVLIELSLLQMRWTGPQRSLLYKAVALFQTAKMLYKLQRIKLVKLQSHNTCCQLSNLVELPMAPKSQVS